MNALKVLICDDIEEIRRILTRLVQAQEGFEVCATAADGDAAIALFSKHRPQVVLLDVEMPGKTGIEIAKFIQDVDPRTHVIFATAHSQFMDSAFEVYAFDYWVKPFKKERVISTLKRIYELRRQLDSEPAPPAAAPKRDISRLMIKKKDAVVFVDTGDIILVQREDRATAIYTADEVHKTSDSLTAIEQKLDAKQFFRSHKSYLINLSYVDSITPYGRWTYVVRFKGIRGDALITSDKLDELKERFD